MKKIKKFVLGLLGYMFKIMFGVIVGLGLIELSKFWDIKFGPGFDIVNTLFMTLFIALSMASVIGYIFWWFTFSIYKNRDEKIATIKSLKFNFNHKNDLLSVAKNQLKHAVEKGIGLKKENEVTDRLAMKFNNMLKQTCAEILLVVFDKQCGFTAEHLSVYVGPGGLTEVRLVNEGVTLKFINGSVSITGDFSNMQFAKKIQKRIIYIDQTVFKILPF